MSSLTTGSPTTYDSDDNNNFSMVIDKEEENEYIAKLKAYIYNKLFDSTIDPDGKLPIWHDISKDFREKIQSALKANEKHFKPELISQTILGLIKMLQSVPHANKAAYTTVLSFGNMQSVPYKNEVGELDTVNYLLPLFDILNCLLAPTENLKSFLSSLKEKKPVCGKVFKDGDLAYTCLDCRTDGTCVVCEECFVNSNHEGHRYRYHQTSAGGICDCGDHEAWDPAGFCDQHCGLGGNNNSSGSRKNDDNEGNSLPQNFKKSCEVVINNIIKYLTMYSMQDYASFSTLPKNEDENADWIVCLHNDDKHTYRNVIEAVTGTFSLIERKAGSTFLSPDKNSKAELLTKTVDEKGYGIVYRGKLNICKQVAKKLTDHGLIVSIKSGTWEIETAISIFFISWLRFISDASASIASCVSKVLCEFDIANNPYIDLNNSNSTNIMYEGKMEDIGRKVSSNRNSNNNNNNSYIVEELKDVKLYRRFKNHAVFWVPGFANVKPVWYVYNEDKAEWSWSHYRPKEKSDLEKFRSVTTFDITSGTNRMVQLATINKNIITFLMENPDLGRNYLNNSIREDAWKERSSKRQKMTYTSAIVNKNTSRGPLGTLADDRRVSIELLIKYDDVLAKPVVLALHDLYAVLWTSDATFKSIFSIYYIKNLPNRCYKYMQGIGTDGELLERVFCVQVFTTPSIVDMLSLKFNCMSSILAALHLSFVDQFDEKSKRLALKSWGLDCERISMAYDHLYYTLRIPNAARIFVWKDSTNLGLFLHFVSYFQEMTSFERKEQNHVLYENNEWQSALNQIIRLGTRFFGILNESIINEDISFTGGDSVTTLKSRKESAKKSLLNFSLYVTGSKLQKLPMLASNNYISSDLYKDVYGTDGKGNATVLYARTAVSQAMVTLSSWAVRSSYLPLVRILDTPIGTYPVFMFDVAKETLSIYYPLNIFIAMLIYNHESLLNDDPRKRRKNSTLNGLFPIKPNEAFKSQRVFTKTQLSRIHPKEIYEVPCVEDGKTDLGGATWLGRLLLLEIPLRTAAYIAQVLRGLWVRNGRGLHVQAVHFVEPPFCVIFNDMILKMLQIAVVGVGVDHFLTALIDRFGLTTWLYDEYEIRGINQEGEYKGREGVGRFGREKAMEITSECLRLIIYLVSDLTPVGTSDFNIRKEAVHILATGPKRRSEMMKKIRQVTGESLFNNNLDQESIWNQLEPHLKEVAIFRAGEEGEPGTYVLKNVFLCEYDPYFKHLTREEHNKVREKIIANRAEMYVKDGKARPPVHKLGPAIENFEVVRQMLLSPALLEVLRPLLARAEKGKLSADVRALCLHLLGIAMMYLNEKRADGQDSICFRFLRAITLRHPCGIKDMLVVGPDIEDGSVLHSLTSLYKNQAVIPYDNEEKVELEAYEYIFVCLKSHDRDFPMCGQITSSIESVESLRGESKNSKNSSSDNDDGISDTISNKISDGKARQNAVIEQMQQQQQAFLAMMGDDSDTESEEEESSSDDDNEYEGKKRGSASNSKVKEDSANSHNKRTCIFCHEDITIKLHGYIGFGYQPVDHKHGYSLHCCSHVAHVDCLDAYLAMQNGRQNHTIDTTDNAEFLCPLCKRLSNVLIPAVSYSYIEVSNATSESEKQNASSEFAPEFTPKDLQQEFTKQPKKKITFRKAGARAELLRFLTTLSNNRFRHEDPDRLHQQKDMLSLLYSTGEYSLRTFVEGAMSDNNKTGDNSFEKVELAFQTLTQCIIASSDFFDDTAPHGLEGLHILCNDLLIPTFLENECGADHSLEKSLISACQYSKGDTTLFHRLFQILYAAYILKDLFEFTSDAENEEDKTTTLLINKIKREYLNSENVVIERLRVGKSFLCMKRKQFIHLYLFFLNAMEENAKTNYRSFEKSLEEFQNLEYMEKQLQLPSFDDIMYKTRWASWLKCWFKGSVINGNTAPSRRKQLTLILDELEPQYDRLLAGFKSELARVSNNDRIQPCLCLACGKVLPGGLKDANNVGACHRHVNVYGECRASVLGIGMMLDLRSTSTILIRNKWAAYYPSLYVDEYGETDRNMRRGAPLHLNITRLSKLRKLWFSGGISNEVVKIRSSSDRVIMENWY
eukprot:g7495.t1